MLLNLKSIGDLSAVRLLLRDLLQYPCARPSVSFDPMRSESIGYNNTAGALQTRSFRRSVPQDAFLITVGR